MIEIIFFTSHVNCRIYRHHKWMLLRVMLSSMMRYRGFALIWESFGDSEQQRKKQMMKYSFDLSYKQ